MKKNKPIREYLCHSLKKTLLIMRIAVILLLVGFLQTRANDAYSQKTKLSVEFSDTKLVEVLDQIENKSEFFFLYNEKLIDTNRKVSIRAKDQGIEEVLKSLFAGADVFYSIIDRKIILTPMDHSSTTQQQKSVSGKVTDSSGAPLPGVSVVIKGTTTGIITDSNGNYTIPTVPENAIMQFSFVGMKTQEIPTVGKSIINVNLIEETIGIDEVVAVGYGTQKKSDITGSLTSVKTSDYKDQPIINPADILKGRVAGVSITQSSGNLSGDYKIRVRGANSLSLSNEPLLVIDGIQMAIGLNQINPNDIASLEILKDASSTAIYGSRGANGVVLITTKSGFEGPSVVEFNTSFSFKQAKNPWDMVDPVAYAEYVNSRATVGSPIPYSAEAIDKLRTNGGYSMYDALLQNGLLRSSQVSVSGGSKATKFFISGGYDNEDGVIVETNFSKIMFRSNISTQISKKLSLGLSLTATQRKGHNVSNSYQELHFANLWGPAEPIFNADGTYRIRDPYGANTNNPYMTIKEAFSDSKTTNGIIGSTLKYEILPGLTFNSNAGINYYSSDYGYVYNDFMKYKFVNKGSGRTYNQSTFWQMSNTLTYSKIVNDIHSMTVMAGYEASQNRNTNFSGNGTGLLLDAVGYDNLGLNSIQSISSSFSASALQSYFARANYSLKDRYLFTFTYRIDGSSKFQPKNHYSYFPSLGLAWRLSEEEFIKKLNVFDNLKLRYSWGKTGNQNLNSYQTLGLLTIQNSSFGTGTMYPGYKPYGASNPGLIWETTTQSNLGIDASFFKDRLSFTIDAYQKQTTDLLQQFSVPDYNGGGTVWKNIGEIDNRGIDFSLNAIPVINENLRWDIGLNLGLIENTLISLGGEDVRSTGNTYYSEETLFALKVGEPLGTFWGYKWLGIWKSSEAAEAAKFGAKPGDNKFADNDKDYKISGADYQVIGHAMPTFRMGFNTTIKYKDFSLNALFESVLGAQTYNMTLAYGAINTSHGQTITLAEGMNFWSPTNENAKYANPFSNTNLPHTASSQFILNSDYLKLKNIALSYNLSKEKIHFADMKLFISAQNILTFTNYRGGDPEGSATGSRDVDSGLDFGVYPVVKSYTAGITLTF